MPRNPSPFAAAPPFMLDREIVAGCVDVVERPTDAHFAAAFESSLLRSSRRIGAARSAASPATSQSTARSSWSTSTTFYSGGRPDSRLATWHLVECLDQLEDLDWLALVD